MLAPLAHSWLLLQGDGKLGGGRVEQPRAGREMITIKTCDHKDREPAVKAGVANEPAHRRQVDVARANLEARMAVPLANIIEALVVMFSPVEEANGIPSGLQKVHDKPREGPGPP